MKLVLIIIIRHFITILDRLHVDPPAGDILEMTWDHKLAAKSQEWADNCELAYDPKGCTFSYDSVGQDIYASFHSEEVLRNAITSWGEEKKYYNYDNNSCTPGQICGHYTQVSDINYNIFSPEFYLLKIAHISFIF